MISKSLLKRYAKSLQSIYRNRLSPMHAERFLARLRTLQPGCAPIDLFRGMSDAEFYWAIAHSHELGQHADSLVPEVPSPVHQRSWTGATGDDTFRQAFDFSRLVLSLARKHVRKAPADLRILDFGCGWGRILRFFLRDVPHSSLQGCDCWDEILEISRSHNKWCTFSQVGAFPPSAFPDESFDVVYLYSVFSHVSEECHLQWMREFRRILKPGGIVVATTRSIDYLRRMDRNRKSQVSQGLMTSMLATGSFPDLAATFAQYERGEYCYSGTGGGGPLDESFYGEACIPPSYARTRWEGFSLLEAIEPHGALDQVTFCAQKAT